MTVKECDRCGSKMRSSRKDTPNGSSMIDITIKSKGYWGYLPAREKINQHNYDLCPKCTKLFVYNFIKCQDDFKVEEFKEAEDD